MQVEHWELKNSFPYPKSIPLAYCSSRIEFLEKLTKELNGPGLYIKRDDDISNLLSGNKVRKLEFFLADALEKGADTLITCGGIQSNHARATAIAARRMGLDCHLILRGKKPEVLDGNLLLDWLVGAKVTFVTKGEYLNRDRIFDKLENKLIQQGKKPYSIPEGGSNSLGAVGYVKAMEEIRNQMKEIGVEFDTIITAVGSGGTYAGLWMGKRFFHIRADVVGINVSATAQYFLEIIFQCVREAEDHFNVDFNLSMDEIQIIDGYVGKGYAKSQLQEIELIRHVARLEGIILDPVYTGKTMFGLVDQIKKGRFKKGENILFIHTGGIFGLFPFREWFKKNPLTPSLSPKGRGEG